MTPRNSCIANTRTMTIGHVNMEKKKVCSFPPIFINGGDYWLREKEFDNMVYTVSSRTSSKLHRETLSK